jgi:predicted phage terminase large subunit-like protein
VIQESEIRTLLMRKAVAMDLATSTKNQADNTVALPGALGSDGNFYLFRPVWGRMESPDAEERTISLCQRFRPQRLGVETVAFQLSQVQRFKRRRELLGIRIVEVPADRDKIARAKGWAPDLSDGLIYLVEDGSGWTEEAIKEAERFPRGKHDDLVDAIGILLQLLREFSSSSALVGGKRDDPISPR